MRRKWIFIVPAAIVGILLFIAIGGEVVLQLWNWLLPTIFGWRRITFWQAVGILALCRILFGRVGGPRAYRAKSMNAEERERFRQRIRERFFFGPPSESQGQ